MLTSSSPHLELSRTGCPQCNSSTYRTPGAASAIPRRAAIEPVMPRPSEEKGAANRFSRCLSSPSERSALMRCMVARKLKGGRNRSIFRGVLAVRLHSTRVHARVSGWLACTRVVPVARCFKIYSPGAGGYLLCVRYGLLVYIQSTC